MNDDLWDEVPGLGCETWKGCEWVCMWFKVKLHSTLDLKSRRNQSHSCEISPPVGFYKWQEFLEMLDVTCIAYSISSVSEIWDRASIVFLESGFYEAVSPWLPYRWCFIISLCRIWPLDLSRPLLTSLALQHVLIASGIWGSLLLLVKPPVNAVDD